LSGAQTETKKRAEIRGRRAEVQASLMLRLKGYRILARGFRTPVGEIDIVAKKGRTLVAIEVKQRADIAQGLQAISPRQQSRISNALQVYLSKNPAYQSLDQRFDAVVVVRKWGWPYHLKNAW